MPPDRLAVGDVWHRRSGPRPHAFRYRLGMTLFDPSRIDRLCAASRLWSIERPNLVTFRRSDYIEPRTRPIDEAVRDLVESDLGFRPAGTVRMLTHLRQWGSCFNPVTFYFCERSGGGLDAEGRATYIDNRGERDHTFPPSHDFEWVRSTRDDHVLGQHPHINVCDTIFVECTEGDFTIKIENNTDSGAGIFSEEVPKTATGKIQKYELRRREWDDEERMIGEG